MSKYIKKYLLLIIFVLFIFSISAYAQEIEEDLTQYKTVENKIAGEPYLNPKWIEWNSLSDEEKSEWKVIPEKFIVDYVYNTNEKLLQPYSFNTYNLKPNSQTMPSTYNLKDEGYVSPIKNQSTLGLCWAFATVGSIESNALKTLGKSLIFSERQIDYALSNPISSVTEGYNPYGNTDRILGTGGNFADANKLFLGGISPQLTSIWGNYNTSSTKQSLSKIIDNNNIEYQITNTVNFPYIDMSTASDEAKDSYIKMIKQHIMNCKCFYQNFSLNL